tara:strand:- start:23359 stop:24528 length:1170 start_codon:yes stop_codon:yes gene_type:complete
MMNSTLKKMKKQRVIVAMSGGVDSSVAAYLLSSLGYEVIGVTLRLWSTEDDSQISTNHQGCCSIDDIEDARLVCQSIQAPHYVIDARKEFQDHVIEYFTQEYQKGRTPHPCIACNDRIKFDFLLNRSQMMNADYIATGHYARIIRNESQGYVLQEGIDRLKDQSYVLFGLNQLQLGKILLPIGGYTKTEIRDLALRAGLHIANKQDSQEICFIPSGDYRQFIKNKINPIPGDIIDHLGNVIGQHPGVEFFTVGQRRGLQITPSQLGFPEGEKVFVTNVDPISRTITVGSAADLLGHSVLVDRVNYIEGFEPSGPVSIDAKIRYNGLKSPAVLYPNGESAVLKFKYPQRAITPGQAAVFYSGDYVLGGGYIGGSAIETSGVIKGANPNSR